MRDDVPLTFNRREIIVPFHRVGVRALELDELTDLWKSFGDFHRSPVAVSAE